MNKKNIVLISTADWDNPFWTNKQHVAVELARRGFRVLYVDSLGLRRPSVSSRDLIRIVKRVIKAVRPPRKARDNLWVWSPIVLPWNGNSVVRIINRVLLRMGLGVWEKWLSLKRPWLWTYNPMTAELLSLDRFACRIYHCVDEIRAQPGMPAEAIEAAEYNLARNVDVIFATSKKLAETRRAWNGNTFYLPNVADYGHFMRSLTNEVKVPADLEALSRPRIGFVGAISGYKIDFHLIRYVAEARPEWSIVLIGQVGEGDPWTDIAALEGVSNVHFLGPRPYKDLPAYLKGIDVAVLPNNVNEYTEAMFPMKFFEYLASGRPVVAVNLDALRDYSDVAYLADSREKFVEAIQRCLEGDVPPLEERLRVAREHTYEARTRTMIDLIEKVCRA